jgi:protein-L-isoaspartate(D-aspartate) O-methyltransferase
MSVCDGIPVASTVRLTYISHREGAVPALATGSISGDGQMADSFLQRKNMVEGQVRTSDVTDRRITAAMMTVPREIFVPKELAGFAYSDQTLTVAAGAVMLPPAVLAKLVQLSDVDAHDKVLVAGGAPGYAAAILAQIATTIVALCPDDKSAALMSEALGKARVGNVTVVAGSLADGWAAEAPYDVILVEGGVETVPKALTNQLVDGGRLVAVGLDRRMGSGFVLLKDNELITRREAFQASAPMLPGFEAARPAFVF